jgi:hypothetical protein
MKKLTLLFVLFVCTYSISHSQGCLPEGITFSTQAQIDNFQNDYPGCTVIEGDVEIYGDDINNIDGLFSIIYIGGKLVIGSPTLSGPFNPLLYDISGFNNLTFIGGNLEIVRNQSLQNISGFSSTSSIAGNFIIGANNVLNDLSGLTNLTSIENFLIISYNDSLMNLNGFNNLTVVGDGLVFSFNEHLKTLEGVNNLISSGYSIKIENNPDLISIYALENIDLNSILFLKIFENASLSKCSIQNFCSILSSPQFSVEIYDNAVGCNNIDEFAVGCTVCLPYGIVLSSQMEIDNFRYNYTDCNIIDGNVVIEGNDITQLDSLFVLSAINGNLEIRNSPVLSNIEGLQNLSEINDSLIIVNNPLLSTCSIFAICSNIVSSNGYVKIENNASGCNSVSEIEIFCSRCLPEGVTFSTQEQIDNFPIDYPFCKVIEGNVDIHGFDNITNLIGLLNLDSILGSLTIKSNDLITGLYGLQNLGFIGNGLFIGNNLNLSFLFHLNNLNSINGILSISNNESLTSLSGLDNIDAGSISELTIIYNNSLSACAVLSICNFLSSLDGPVNIYVNNGNCDNALLVQTACLVDIEEITAGQISIHPNPATKEVIITILNEIVVNEVIIYNQLGQSVLSEIQVSKAVDISMLKPGIYIIDVDVGNSRIFKKLVIE